MTNTLRALVAVLILGATSSAATMDFTFGFEGQAATGPTNSATIEKDGWKFTITRAAMFEFVDLSPYQVPGGVPSSWGARTLSPFVNPSDPEGFVLTLLEKPNRPGTTTPWAGVVGASIQFGDFAPSDIDNGYFAGAGLELRNDSGGFFDFSTGFSSPVPLIDVGDSMPFGGGVDLARLPPGTDFNVPNFPQSLFWDQLVFTAIDELPENVVAPPLAPSADPNGGAGGIPSNFPGVPPVPEPGTIALIGMAGAAAWLHRRRRSSK